jgi:hypothetical protein
MTTATARLEEGREIMRKREAENEKLEIADRTLALMLTCRRGFGTKRKVKAETRKKMLAAVDIEDVDEETINVGKTLFVHPTIKSITDELNAIRATVRARALPIRFFKKGIYLFSAGRVDATEAFIAEGQDRIGALLDELERDYPEIIAKDEARLGPVEFDPGDYPPIAALRSKVRVTYRWAQFSAPTEMQGVSEAVIASEREKARALYVDAFDEIRAMQISIVEEFVSGLQACLRPGEDGKKRVLKQARVDKMQAFLRDFAIDNVTGFDELAKIVGKAKVVLDGVDAEVIRTEDGYRARLDKTLAEIKTDLKPLAIEATRRVKLDD